MKEPDRWPAWLVRFTAWLNTAYGVSVELANRHTWESIDRDLTPILFRAYDAGALYLAAGESKERQNPAGEKNV